MFKKILLSAVFGLAFCLSLMAQEKSAPVNGGNTNLRSKTMNYAPTFYTLKAMDSSIELKDYELIKQIISDVENEYLRRIIVQMQFVQSNMDGQTERNNEYVFQSSLSYYDLVVKTARDNNYLLSSIDNLKNAYDKFNAIHEALIANKVPEVEVKDVEYKLNKFLGMLYMFKGDVYNLRLANIHLTYILFPDKDNVEGKALTTDKENMIELYNLLVGVNHNLYEKTKGDGVLATHYLRSELYFLWKLVEVQVDNEDLRKYKYKNLAKTYYSIIDFNGRDFEKMYKPVVDELGLAYKSTEQKVTESSGQIKTPETAPK